MFFTNENKEEIKNRYKGITAMVIPDSKMPEDNGDTDAEMLMTPFGMLARDAVRDARSALALQEYNKLVSR